MHTFRRRISALVLLLIVGLIAGCGGGGGSSGRPVHHNSTTTFTCHHEHPDLYEAGECIRQYEEFKGRQPFRSLAPPAPLALRGRAQCVDISRWQGIPDWGAVRRSGVRCAIIQTNDGGVTNPFFSVQAAGALRAGIKIGAYLFVEPRSSAEQAALSLRVSRGHGVTLGTWADTEVPGAYEHECGIVSYVRSHGVRIAGGYTSPGLWPGLHGCGFVWPAEWGSAEPSAPTGWAQSAIKFRQWCGTCRLLGFSGEVDRDEDVGLLHLVAAKHRPPVSKHVQLVRAYHLRAVLRANIARHGCRRGHGPVRPRSYRGTCRRWLREGSAVNAKIRALHAKGVW